MSELCMTSAKISDADKVYLIDECIQKVALGDQEALRILYDTVSSRIYAFALAILKNPHDAEDVLHDCFISVYNNAFQYTGKGKPMAWLLTITRNLCFMKLREMKNRSSITESEEIWGSYENLSAEDRMVIRQCMEKLSSEERQIVVLHAMTGFKHREIAELLDMRVSTVLSKYNRAIKKLRVQLKKGGVDNE